MFVSQDPHLNTALSLTPEVSTPAGGGVSATSHSNTPEPPQMIERLRWLNQDSLKMANAARSAEAAYLRQQEQKSYMSVLKPGTFEEQQPRRRAMN